MQDLDEVPASLGRTASHNALSHQLPLTEAVTVTPQKLNDSPTAFDSICQITFSDIISESYGHRGTPLVCLS